MEIRNSVIPKPAGEALAQPPTLSSPQEDLCQRLDGFYAQYTNLKIKPSVMFRGALFTSQSAFRNSNPDWISQASNSLREILYPFKSNNVGGGLQQALRDHGSIKAGDLNFETNIDELYIKLNDITHHGTAPRRIMDITAFTPADFDALLVEFEKVMLEALTVQLDVHAEFKDIISQGPPS